MACPNCGCKVHYQYDGEVELFRSDDRMQRCASCRHVFDIEDSANEDDDEPAARGVDVPLAPSTKPMPFDEAAVHTLAIRHGVGGKLSDLCAFARGVLDAHGCGVGGTDGS